MSVFLARSLVKLVSSIAVSSAVSSVIKTNLPTMVSPVRGTLNAIGGIIISSIAANKASDIVTAEFDLWFPPKKKEEVKPDESA